MLAKKGEMKAKEMINYTITKGYQGLLDPNDTKKPFSQPTQRFNVV